MTTPIGLFERRRDPARSTCCDDEVSDAIRVVRCQPIEGAGSLFHVGAEFLWTDSPKPTALRRFVHRAAGHVQGVRASIGP